MLPQRVAFLRATGHRSTLGKNEVNTIIVTVVALAIYLGIWIWLKLPH